MVDQILDVPRHETQDWAQCSDAGAQCGATGFRNFSGVTPRCFAAYVTAACWLLKKAFLSTHHPPNDLAPGLRQDMPSYRATDLGQGTESVMTNAPMDLMRAIRRTISAAFSGVLPLPNSFPCM